MLASGGLSDMLGLSSKYGLTSRLGLSSEFGLSSQYGLYDNFSLSSKLGLSSKFGLSSRFGLSSKLVVEFALLAWSPWGGPFGSLGPLGFTHGLHRVESPGVLGPMHHTKHCHISCMETRICGNFSWNIWLVENGSL